MGMVKHLLDDIQSHIPLMFIGSLVVFCYADGDFGSIPLVDYIDSQMNSEFDPTDLY
jgi:hypothetical protein